MANSSCSCAAAFSVFIDTNLDTRLAMMVSAQDTVLDLKRQIMEQHPLCFPDHGEITIQAVKVTRKSFFYHLTDGMILRSAFLGSNKTWFVHVDAASVSVTNNGPGLVETSLRSKNGGEQQKYHLPSSETEGDSQAIQNDIVVSTGTSAKRNVLQSDSKAVLLNDCQNMPSSDMLVEMRSLGDDSSLPQVRADSPKVTSNHQDVDAGVSNPEEGNLAAEVVPSVESDRKLSTDWNHVDDSNKVQDVDAGVSNPEEGNLAAEVVPSVESDPKLSTDWNHVDDSNKVQETHNFSEGDVIIDERGDNNRKNESKLHDLEDRSDLIDNHKPAKKRGRNKKLGGKVGEELQVSTKNHRKRKGEDVIAESVLNSVEDARACANLVEGSANILRTDDFDNQMPDATHGMNKTKESIATDSLAGATDSDKFDDVKEAEENASDKALISSDEIPKKSKKHHGGGVKSSNLSPVEDQNKRTSNMTPVANEDGNNRTDHDDIHQPFETGNEDDVLPKTVGMKKMKSKSKSTEDEIDTSNLQEATEASVIANVTNKKGKKSKKSGATATKSLALSETVNYIDDAKEIASLKSNPHGPDGMDDGNLTSGQNAIDKTKMENASSKKKEFFETGPSNIVMENETFPSELLPISKTEVTIGYGGEKVKRRAKKKRSSNSTAILESSTDMQLDAHKTMGDLANLDIHHADENEVNDSRRKVEDEKENFSPKKRKLGKSDKSSKALFVGPVLEGEDMKTGTEPFQLNNTMSGAKSMNDSHSEAQGCDINFKEFFVSGTAELGDSAKEPETKRKTNERKTRNSRKSNIESVDTSHLQNPLNSQCHPKQITAQNCDSGPVELERPPSKGGKSKRTRNHDQTSSGIFGDGMENQPESVDGTIYDGKLGRKLPLKSNQYYVAVNKAQDKKLEKVSVANSREKSLLATSDSIFKHAIDGGSSEDGENDSDATTSNGLSDNSSSSSDSDEKQRSSLSKTPALKKRARQASSNAHSELNNGNDADDIVLSQSSLSMLLRKSSSYRKAKLMASQSQFDDSESQPIDMVPDSQAVPASGEVHVWQ